MKMRELFLTLWVLKTLNFLKILLYKTGKVDLQ